MEQARYCAELPPIQALPAAGNARFQPTCQKDSVLCRRQALVDALSRRSGRASGDRALKRRISLEKAPLLSSFLTNRN